MANLMCMIITITYVYRVVKLSSPNLNYLIVAGAALAYASVFLYIFSEREHQHIAHEVLCNVRKNHNDGLCAIIKKCISFHVCSFDSSLFPLHTLCALL